MKSVSVSAGEWMNTVRSLNITRAGWMGLEKPEAAVCSLGAEEWYDLFWY